MLHGQGSWVSTVSTNGTGPMRGIHALKAAPEDRLSRSRLALRIPGKQTAAAWPSCAERRGKSTEIPSPASPGWPQPFHERDNDLIGSALRSPRVILLVKGSAADF